MKRTIYSIFKETADKYSEHSAIIEDDRTLTFSQLDRMADSIASKFYDRQSKSVGIVMHHRHAIHNGSLSGLLKFVERHGVTIIDGFPYLLAEMNKLDYIPKSIKLIISGGDVIRSSYITRLKDLGYKLPDGNIAFLNRRDNQVMILGKRVEPEEVENVLNTCRQVERGVVRAFLDENGLHYLTAYIIPKEGTTLKQIRKYLSNRLTDFMVPEFFVKVKTIPLTRRGKVDVDSLPVVMKEGGV